MRPEVFVLLVKQRLRLTWNRITRGPNRVRHLLGVLVVTIFSFGFVMFAGLNAGLVVDRVARADPPAALRALPALLAAAAALTLVTSISSAFHHLFLAGDLELLLAAPVPPGTLFGLKVLEIWRDSLHVLLFEAAALYGFGQSLDLPLSFYVAAAAVGLLLSLGASAVGGIVTLVVARVRFGESVLGLSRLLAILLFLPVGVLGVPALGGGRGRISLLLNQPNLNAVTDELRTIGEPPPWSPMTWAAHVALGDDFAALSLGLLVATAVVVVIATRLAFVSLFQGGWERVRFPAATSAARRVAWRLPLARLSGGPVMSVVSKDWRTVLRDPRWRTGTLVTLLALGFPVVALFSADPLARSPHLVRFWFGLLPVPYLAFLVGSQQGASTLAYEGRNLALLRAAPVRIGRVLAAKVAGGLMLVLFVTWAATLALGVSRGGALVELVLALGIATWLALGASLSAVAGTALTADFDGDNPQRRVGCLGTIVTSGLSVFFFLTNTGTIAWWVARGAVRLPLGLLGLVPFFDWGLPVLAVVAVAAIVLTTSFGMRRLATWEVC